MAGLVGFTGPPDPELLNRMLRRLEHRGQPAARALVTPNCTLAAVDWKHAPKLGTLRSGNHRLKNGQSAVIAGFTFGDPELANDLNTCRLMAAKSFRGSFTIGSPLENGMLIGRDPTGCQALYFARTATRRWLIASEPKAITGEKEFSCRLRIPSLAQYLAFSFVPGEQTMLEGLYELEAGHIAELNTASNQASIERYFEFESGEPDPADLRVANDNFWIKRTKDCVEQAVAERLTDDPQAVFLSGGLDSSIVAAEVAKQSKNRVHTYSIHFGNKYSNELEFAREVASRINSIHEEVFINPREFEPNISKMVWHLDEPIGDPITQPNFELAERVSGSFPSVFNGEGGDPLFGGPKNIPLLLQHWYGGVDNTPGFRERAYLASYRRAYEEWPKLLSRDVAAQITPERDLECMLTNMLNCDSPKYFLNKLMAINIRLKGANLILPKVDRMLAAHGVTPLSPLFDDRLTKLSLEMPPNLKMRNGIEKWVLKEAYRELLPPRVVDRPKSGMRVPVHFWFEKELKSLAKRTLRKRELRASGLFDPERVEDLRRYRTEEGPGRYGLRLWMLITFQLWAKHTGASTC